MQRLHRLVNTWPVEGSLYSVIDRTSSLPAGLGVIAMQPHRIAFDTTQHAAEAFPPFMGDGHLDLHQMAGEAFKVGTAHQRAVDAR